MSRLLKIIKAINSTEEKIKENRYKRKKTEEEEKEAIAMKSLSQLLPILSSSP